MSPRVHADRVTFTITAAVTLAPTRTVNVDEYNEACEAAVKAVDGALDEVVDLFAHLGDWVVTVEGTQ